MSSPTRRNVAGDDASESKRRAVPRKRPQRDTLWMVLAAPALGLAWLLEVIVYGLVISPFRYTLLFLFGILYRVAFVFWTLAITVGTLLAAAINLFISNIFFISVPFLVFGIVFALLYVETEQAFVVDAINTFREGVNLLLPIVQVAYNLTLTLVSPLVYLWNMGSELQHIAARAFLDVLPPETVNALLGALGTVFGAIIDGLVNAGPTLTSFFNGVAPVISSIIEGFFDLLNLFVPDNLLGELVNTLRDIVDGLHGPGKFITTLSTLFLTIPDKVDEVAKKADDTIGGIVDCVGHGNCGYFNFLHETGGVASSSPPLFVRQADAWAASAALHELAAARDAFEARWQDHARELTACAAQAGGKWRVWANTTVRCATDMHAMQQVLEQDVWPWMDPQRGATLAHCHARHLLPAWLSCPLDADGSLQPSYKSGTRAACWHACLQAALERAVPTCSINGDDDDAAADSRTDCANAVGWLHARLAAIEWQGAAGSGRAATQGGGGGARPAPPQHVAAADIAPRTSQRRNDGEPTAPPPPFATIVEARMHDAIRNVTLDMLRLADEVVETHGARQPHVVFLHLAHAIRIVNDTRYGRATLDQHWHPIFAAPVRWLARRSAVPRPSAHERHVLALLDPDALRDKSGEQIIRDFFACKSSVFEDPIGHVLPVGGAPPKYCFYQVPLRDLYWTGAVPVWHIDWPWGTDAAKPANEECPGYVRIDSFSIVPPRVRPLSAVWHNGLRALSFWLRLLPRIGDLLREVLAFFWRVLFGDPLPQTLVDVTRFVHDLFAAFVWLLSWTIRLVLTALVLVFINPVPLQRDVRDALDTDAALPIQAETLCALLHAGSATALLTAGYVIAVIIAAAWSSRFIQYTLGLIVFPVAFLVRRSQRAAEERRWHALEAQLVRRMAARRQRRLQATVPP